MTHGETKTKTVWPCLRQALKGVFYTVTLVVATFVLYLMLRFLPDRAVSYADPEMHFKYGSTGGERESGFPYWIWQTLPSVCAEHLPAPAPEGQEYAAFGMIYEENHDLPVGVSMRRVTGLDRVFLNCAACHVSTVRDIPSSPPRIITAMPANTLNLMAFEKFFFDCASDGQFSASHIVPAIQEMFKKDGKSLGLFDRYVVYPIAISLMREQLLMLKDRFAVVLSQPEWGPGRVDTFNSAKALFPFLKLSPQEQIGAADFPSIWNQRLKKGMQLHWDGNNTRVEERNRSAAFGTGATPPTLDRARIRRVEAWLLSATPPPYPYTINPHLADQGAPLYRQYCAVCHGQSGQDFSGEKVGQVTPIAEIGTDRHRLDSYTRELAVNQGTLYAGYESERFTHFRKTFGYANMPLDGLWLRAPYLHNGAVPTLRDLLEPSANRPQRFYRGNDVYDSERVGFVSDVPDENGRAYFVFDTALDGNSNQGHEGPAYGTDLAPDQKAALLEYLKQF
jgi:mono/diheme cytochrome c family protein